MKKIYRNIILGMSILAIAIACTKEITEDAIQRSFSFEFAANEINSILNIPQSTTFTISSAGATAQEDFRFKYNVTQGAGFFVIDEVIIKENELTSLSKGSSFTIEYVGIQVGEHKVSIAIRDSRNEEKEIQLVFNVKDSAFEVTIVPDAPSTYVNGIVDLDFTIIEVIPAEYSLVYTFVGADADGSGKGTISTNGISIEPEKEVSIENIEEFTLQFAGKELGVVKLEVTVKSNLGKELKKEIEITVTETPEFIFSAMLENADPTTNQVETFIQTPVTVNFGIEETVGSSSYKGTYTSTNEGSFVYNDITYSAGQEIPVEAGVSSGQYIGKVAGDHEVVFTVANANIVPSTMEAGFTIVCKDPEKENPVITLLGDSSLKWDVNVEFVDPGFTVVDNDDPEIESKVEVTGEVDVTFPGTYELAYNVQDASGNKAETKMREVLVKDRIAPVISLNGNNPLVLVIGSSWSDPVTATDNYDSDDEITQKIVYGGNFTDTSTKGEYERTYNVSDASNNAADEKVREIRIVEDMPPVINITGDNPLKLNAVRGGSYTDPGATGTDDVDDDIALTERITTSGTVDITTPGRYTITYNVTDSAMNMVKAERVVNIVDEEAPVISLNDPSSVTHSVNTPYTDPEATATDNVDNTVSVVTMGSVDITKLGPNVLTYTATDMQNNEATTTKTVEVIDDVNPIIRLNGPTEVQVPVNASYTETATVEDNYDQNVELEFGGDFDGSTNIVRIYERTYTARDASGNEAESLTRTINVVDNLAPVMTLNGDSFQVLRIGQTYNEKGVTITDNYDTDIEPTITGSVNENIANFYVLKYDAEDSSGNKATTLSRTVTVANDPVARINPRNVTGKVPFTVNFDAYGSTSDGIIIAVKWNFGDGSPIESHDDEDPPIPHTFNSVGTFTVSIEILDEYGFTDTTSTTVNVTN